MLCVIFSSAFYKYYKKLPNGERLA